MKSEDKKDVNTQSGDKHYDVFISYRREGGRIAADLTISILKSIDYKEYFIDTEGLETGNFPTQLVKGVKNSAAFIIILSKGALDRCANKDDVLKRCEIDIAIEESKRIIPIFLEDFKENEIAEGVPDYIKNIVKLEGIYLPDRYLADNLKKLLDNTRILCPSFQENMRTYLEKLNHKVQKLTLKGLGGDVELDEVYVDRSLKSAEKNDPRDTERPKQCAPQELLKDKYSVIIGNAGSGKSCMVANLISGIISDYKKPRLHRAIGEIAAGDTVPVLVPLQEYAKYRSNNYNDINGGKKLEAYIKEYRFPDCQKDYDSLRQHTKVLYFFDGMDEVPSESELKETMSDIEAHIGDCHRAIFTSRPLVSAINNADIILNSEKIKKYDLADYSPGEQQQHIDLSFEKLPRLQGKDKNIFSDKLKEAEERSDTFKELSHNPLLLTAILSIYAERNDSTETESAEKNEFPESKAEIYERCFELITAKREKEKHLELPEILTDPLNVQEMMRQLAFIIHKGGNAKQEIESYINNKLTNSGINRNDDEVRNIRENFFEYLERRSLYSENRFLHETFKEYLAAMHIYYSSISIESVKVGLSYEDVIKVDEASINELIKLYSGDLLQWTPSIWVPIIEFLLIIIDNKHKSNFSVLQKIINYLLKAGNYKKEFDVSLHNLFYLNNYSMLCRAVTQFVNHRKSSEALILTDILERTAEEERNPFEDLFYYLLKYDMHSGLCEALNANKLTDQKVRLIVYMIIDKLILCFEPPLEEQLKALKSDYEKRLKLTEDAKTELNGFTYEYAVSSRLGYRLFDGKIDLDDSLKGSCTMFELFNIKDIGDWAFSGCTGLTSIIIPDSVTSIGLCAFSGCTGLTQIKLPDSVTSIGLCAFSGCTGLTSIIIPDNVTSIGESAFSSCTGLTSITIGDSVTSIGSCAFYGCTGLTQIKLSDSVKSIGDWAFWGCTGLTSITIPKGVTSIGDRAFLYCTGLTQIKLPDSVTRIGDSAFWGCTGLTQIKLSDSVKSIGDWAFWGCTGLTSITIPKGVTSIEECAFCECTGLIDIFVDGKNSHYKAHDGVLFSDDMAELIAYPEGKKGAYEVPKSVTNIGNSAFSGCTGLTSIIIPDSVIGIGSDAFETCLNLKEVIIPNNFNMNDYIAKQEPQFTEVPCDKPGCKRWVRAVTDTDKENRDNG